MYVPRYFGIDDLDEMARIIGERSFGTMVVSTPEGFDASALPWLVRIGPESAITLVGHLARANPLVRSIEEDHPTMVIFDQADAYISPSWYPSKQEADEAVPTWNYVSVHVHGRIRLVDDARWLHGLVTELTDRHEGAFDRPWAVSDAPEPFIDRMLRGIVGVEVQVDRVEGKAKLSQNRTVADFDGVLDGLAASAAPVPLVDVMQRHRPA